MSFASMKKNTMSFEELSEKLEDAGGSGKKNYNDERLWYPKLDEQKNGYAVIRFLPTSEKDDLPFVKLYSHGYKSSTGQWYFENCPTTLEDGECPVCDANRAIVQSYGGWDDTPKHIKDGDIRNRKRKLSYYSNIYIVNDSKNPENNGTVRLFRYGKKIFDQLTEAASPSFEDKQPIQPFDMWKGANYKLKIRQVDKQTNYDSSEFELASQFLDDDDAMEKVYNEQFTLKELVAEDQFKSMVDLTKKFNRVEGVSVAKDETVEQTMEEKTMGEKPQFKSSEPVEQKEEVAKPTDTATDEDDEAMIYFNELAK